MTSVACAGTTERIAFRNWMRWLRAASGIWAIYSSTLTGTRFFFVAEAPLVDVLFLASAMDSNPRSFPQATSPVRVRVDHPIQSKPHVAMYLTEAAQLQPTN